MNDFILNEEAQKFINEHLDSDISRLLLSGSCIDNVSTKELVEQIEAKGKSEKKLPTLFKSENIYYPNKLNIEQTSSEVAAQFKSSLFSGKSMVDLTGGLGIDSLYFAKHFEDVIHCETNEHLSVIAKHNFEQLGIDNVRFVVGDGLEFLKKSNSRYDAIYVDPSRRHDVKGKVFFLSDCEPNVPAILSELFNYSEKVMIKTAPLLDITAGLRELRHVVKIYIVAINNEVKELLWVLDKTEKKIKTLITAVNIEISNTESFEFFLENDLEIPSSLQLPLSYLYEPNAAIMKSGGFNSLSARLKVSKLHENSHLYTSTDLIEFPGRRFKILEVLPYQKKLLVKRIPKQANVTIRNFPESVAVLRKKWKITDGGSQYIFFTTDLHNKKIVIICEKI